MTIEILPARLANQIAAGEVVERPASVIKELVENSLDANATKITIEADKGGAKRIKITDNGKGIVKDELTLALSRHATSKIKNLDDLEAINSLGFRGEALASISSVARLTLTSKPAEQENAWQAIAEGREMNVDIQPAAHPNGTTIDVKDLFFNTPARRKFLRTEKTEFSHIEEVVKRIALARFDVTFILIHNGNIIKQYRASQSKAQHSKRIAQICGQKFIENAVEVDCHHDNLHLTGWLAKPTYYRNQNDLCYSYVNGRMMRDKLINHAIRQAYASLLPQDTYPAFVLFLDLEFSDVDVNVHPAKHEVRFHQARYVHDFIYSVCHQALQEQLSFQNEHDAITDSQAGSQSQSNEFIAPLRAENEANIANGYQADSSQIDYKQQTHNQGYRQSTHVSESAAENYQKLMTTSAPSRISAATIDGAIASSAQSNFPQDNEGSNTQTPSDQTSNGTNKDNVPQLGHAENSHLFLSPHYYLISLDGQIRLLSLRKYELALNIIEMEARLQESIISQPLLLPLKIAIEKDKIALCKINEQHFANMGIVLSFVSATAIQVRQFPAMLRDKNIAHCMEKIINHLSNGDVLACDSGNGQGLDQTKNQHNNIYVEIFAALMQSESFDIDSANTLLNRRQNLPLSQINQALHLNSVEVDLTSEIKQLS